MLGHGVQSSRLYQISRLPVKENFLIQHLKVLFTEIRRKEAKGYILKVCSVSWNYREVQEKPNKGGSQTFRLTPPNNN